MFDQDDLDERIEEAEKIDAQYEEERCRLNAALEIATDNEQGNIEEEISRLKIAREYFLTERYQDTQIFSIDAEHQKLANLYILCDKLRDMQSKRGVLAAFVQSARCARVDGYIHWARERTIKKIYDATVAGDLLRCFVVDCYVWCGRPGWKLIEDDLLLFDFLHNVMLRMFQNHDDDDDKEVGSVAYNGGPTLVARNYTDQIQENEGGTA